MRAYFLAPSFVLFCKALLKLNSQDLLCKLVITLVKGKGNADEGNTAKQHDELYRCFRKKFLRADRAGLASSGFV